MGRRGGIGEEDGRTSLGQEALRVGATLDAPMFSLFRRLTPQRLYNALLFRMLPNVRRWGPPSPDHS